MYVHICMHIYVYKLISKYIHITRSVCLMLRYEYAIKIMASFSLFFLYVCMCLHTYMYVCIDMYIHTFIHICICMYVTVSLYNVTCMYSGLTIWY